MLSDEEEILIKKLRYCEQEYEQNGYLSVGKFEAIKEGANLIEKQSKEIEELEKNRKVSQNFAKIVATDYISKDKIKAEIKELQNMKVDGEVFTTSVNYAIKVLQSLLEKE